MGHKTAQRRNRRKRQREAAATASAQRLATRLASKKEDKAIMDWLLSAMGDEEGDDAGDGIPQLLQRAVTDAAGTPLEAITAELLTLMASDDSDGDDDKGFDRLLSWLDRYSDALDQVEDLPEAANSAVEASP